MTNRNQLIAILAIYLMLLSVALVPADAAPRSTAAVGGIVNFNMNGEYSPRSRCPRKQNGCGNDAVKETAAETSGAIWNSNAAAASAIDFADRRFTYLIVTGPVRTSRRAFLPARNAWIAEKASSRDNSNNGRT